MRWTEKNREKVDRKDCMLNRVRSATLQGRFARMLRKWGTDARDGRFSEKASKLGFVDEDALRTHFRVQYKPGMTDDNHGL